VSTEGGGNSILGVGETGDQNLGTGKDGARKDGRLRRRKPEGDLRQLLGKKAPAIGVKTHENCNVVIL